MQFRAIGEDFLEKVSLIRCFEWTKKSGKGEAEKK